MSTDDWSLEGMVVGVGLAILAARRGVVVIKNRPMAIIGAAGLGSLTGTEGSVEWRALMGTSFRHDKEKGKGKGNSEPEKRVPEE